MATRRLFVQRPTDDRHLHSPQQLLSRCRYCHRAAQTRFVSWSCSHRPSHARSTPFQLLCWRSYSIDPLYHCHDKRLTARGISAGRTEARYRHSVAEKPGLDADELKNCRPISNLTFVSKLVERVVASLLVGYTLDLGVTWHFEIQLTGNFFNSLSNLVGILFFNSLQNFVTHFST